MGTSPATCAASAGSFGTSSLVSISRPSARAGSSERMPIPAIRGRIGSGASTATSGRFGTSPLLPSAKAFEEQVGLPGSRAVDLVQDRVQAIDLPVRPRELQAVLLVLREHFREPVVNELVLGRQAVALLLELRKAKLLLPQARLERGNLRPAGRQPDLRPREGLGQAAVTLALVSKLPLGHAVALVPERDLRAHPIEHSRHALFGPVTRVLLVDAATSLLKCLGPRRGVRGVGAVRREDAVLARHRADVAEGSLERRADQEIPVFRVVERGVETAEPAVESAREEDGVKRDVVREEQVVRVEVERVLEGSHAGNPRLP